MAGKTERPSLRAVAGVAPRPAVQTAPREVMPIVMVGHVDHGKSTVVGRLINDTGSMPEGKVEEIQMFSTVLDSPDNKAHVLPNGAILNGGLTNYSEKGSVRVDMKFRISYQSDVEKAKQVLEDILTGDPRVLAEPHPLVFVSGLEESHVEITAWPFVTISEFMLFNKDFAERVKQAFEEAGVLIPLPQQEVYLISDKGAG